jgi:hypothetical protein
MFAARSCGVLAAVPETRLMTKQHFTGDETVSAGAVGGCVTGPLGFITVYP